MQIERKMLTIEIVRSIILKLIGYIQFAYIIIRDIAQFGSALRSGRRGRRFKSCYPDQVKPIVDIKFSYRLLFLAAFGVKTLPCFPASQNALAFCNPTLKTVPRTVFLTIRRRFKSCYPDQKNRHFSFKKMSVFQFYSLSKRVILLRSYIWLRQ